MIILLAYNLRGIVQLYQGLYKSGGAPEEQCVLCDLQINEIYTIIAQ